MSGGDSKLMSGNDDRKTRHGVSTPSALRLTGEDGLVDTQGGGPDSNNPDVSGDFVTNWGRHKEACLLYFTEQNNNNNHHHKQIFSFFCLKTVLTRRGLLSS